MMPPPLALARGRVIDPARSVDRVADVLIIDGCIAAVGQGVGYPDGARVIDVAGCVTSSVTPPMLSTTRMKPFRPTQTQ